MSLTEEMKAEMKRKRLLVYQARIYDLEMDRTAAEAAGDDEALPGIDSNIEKLRLAAAAVERM